MADQQTTRSIIVKGSPAELYHLWADVESFPRFMTNVKSVSRTGDNMTHWVVEGPFGKDVEWDAETTRMEEGKRIAWNSKDGSDVKTSGQLSLSGTMAKLAGSGQTEITGGIVRIN